ncbi:melanocyte protein PMEL-like [Channa argus]|uniref:melanocyte protein PMEL-like n=1 Tax=Channa argus TaxID=215402 RepID=UPI003520C809
MVPSDMEEDNTEDEASSASTNQPPQDTPSVAKTPSPINHDMPADSKAGTGSKADKQQTVTLTGQATVAVVAKREADDKPSDDDCVIYRYGSFCTGIEVYEGIEKVEIIQMNNVAMATPQMNKNVLDITVSCQGSIPKEVCSVILDAEFLRPIHTACNMVEPSKECQMVLHHFFNDSGVYCINVSMANDVSLAVTSAKFNVDIGTQHKNYHIQVCKV